MILSFKQSKMKSTCSIIFSSICVEDIFGGYTRAETCLARMIMGRAANMRNMEIIYKSQ